MFFVYKSNHCLTAWWQHINKYHGSNAEWHLSFDCILLDARRQNGVLLNAMNDINEQAYYPKISIKIFFLYFFFPFHQLCHLSIHLLNCRSIEHDHVKASLPLRLQWIWMFGILPLEEYTKLIFAKEIKICETEKSKHDTWYFLT